MELYQLRTFVAVAQERHLTRAAERLHISQPAVSAHIRALEDELAVALFFRTPRGMSLTAAGEALRARALHVLAAADDLQLHARALSGSVAGKVRLAVHVEPRFVRLPELTAALRKRFAEMRCEFRQAMSWEIVREIREGEIDGGFIYGASELPEVRTEHLRDFRLRVVGPASWQQRIDRAGWPEIADLPWIWTPDHCLFSRIAGACFSERGLSPRQAVVADHEAVLCSLVASGVGLTVMIEDEAVEAFRNGAVSLWPESIGTVPLSFAYPARRADDPLVQAVLHCLGTVWDLPAE
ncbi:MAG: LysR family transcriptional regulator [Desulfobulbaceae bacterium]|nr:MAG: LysR family transcriptional regulator [Desulfobulbaceae bacterium]